MAKYFRSPGFIFEFENQNIFFYVFGSCTPLFYLFYHFANSEENLGFSIFPAISLFRPISLFRAISLNFEKQFQERNKLIRVSWTQGNWIFAKNSNSLITVSLKPNVADLRDN